MQITDLLHPLVIPSLPLLAVVLARLGPWQVYRLAWPSAALATGVAVVLAILPGSEPGLVKLDTLALAMALLVAPLGAIVLRFSTRYMEGDPHRARFLSWMSLSLASVLAMVTSNHLLLLLGAWTATSLSLHRLLLHHPDRPGAVFAARKKFAYSRLADLSLLLAVVLLHHGHGTWHIDALAASIKSGNTAGLPAAAFLLGFCAMLKSAQFPFHSWLPDTMDTPTPVSAFMHAGMINGGGFLVLRLSQVFTATPGALWMLAVVGTITAVFGAISMLVQPGVKRALAFSTIAQMGFMMIQIGLGAWGLALLHLLAHSLYKAHGFLRAGSTIGTVPRAAIPLGTASLAVGSIAAAALVVVVATALHALVPGSLGTPPALLVVLALALAYGLARTWSGHHGSIGRASLVAFGITLVSLALHLASNLWLPTAGGPAAPLWLTGFVITAFVALFLFQSLLWRASAHPLGRTLYVHALNGFYVSTFANRLLNRLWPTRPPA